MNLRFGPPLRSNNLSELMACKRTGSVVEYQDRFESLLPRAGTLSEIQEAQIFTAGLPPPSASTWKYTTRTPSPPP